MRGDTFNSQVKAARSPMKKEIKRGKRNQDPKGRPSPQNLDQIIEEFAKIDTASAAVTKGVQQNEDAATEIEKNKMSPIRTKQLRDDVLGEAISPEQRELLQLLGVLDQAEANFMKIANYSATADGTATADGERAPQATTPAAATADHQATATAEEKRAQHLLPVTLDDDHDDDVFIGGYENWRDIDLMMTLDSGCCKHVLPADAAPGYEISDSPGSRRGQGFTVGNGAKVPNEGQMSLNLEADSGSGREHLRSVFQVANLSRPLMSVSQICQHGYKCVFEQDHANILNESGESICKFQEDRGLYVATMSLKAPTPFGRLER